MSGAGTGYDLSPTTYNPQGRVFQIDYANKAVENGGTIVGLRCSDGIVIGGERNVISRMTVGGTHRLLHGLTQSIGSIITGVIPDGRAVAARARLEASHYEGFYGKQISTRLLTDRTAQYMHAFTSYGVLRPFGVAMILAGMDSGTWKLMMVEPSGRYFEYYACSAGKGNQVCKSEIDKLDLTSLNCKDAVFHLIKMLIKSRDEGQDKRVDIEVGFISADTDYKFVPVPQEVRKEEEERAKEALEREELGED